MRSDDFVEFGKRLEAAGEKYGDGAASNAALVAGMAGDPDPEIRAWVAASPDLSSGMRQRLAEDPDPRVRGRVAGGEWTSAGLVARLTADEHPRVREGAATSIWALPALLAGLASDPDAGVRAAVAANPGVGPDVVVGLANDPDAGVRRAVAGNRVTPADVVESLANDQNSRVRRSAAWCRTTPPGAFDSDRKGTVCVAMRRSRRETRGHSRSSLSSRTCSGPRFEVPQPGDVGTDLYVQVFDERRHALRLVLGVQVRSGPSRFDSPVRGDSVPS